MDFVSLLPVIPVIILVLVAIYFVDRVIGISPPSGRYSAIDGIRGYLAFFVFLHHSVIWYFFLHSGQWAFPPSRVYSHFGPGSVALFFMITSFLFFSKLLSVKDRHMDWLKLYVSRILRIVPLYVFAMLLLFLAVACISNWALNEPFLNVVLECIGWLAFTEPDINGIGNTRLIVAAVVWSLAFEWMFYFSLPFWGLLLFKIKASFNVILFAGILLLIFIWIIAQFYPINALGRISPFLGGIAAAFAARNERIKKLAAGKLVSVLIIALMVVAVVYFPNIYSPIPFLCFALAFIGIACGNTLFGVLSHKASRLFGQISYSIYMLHGLLLFVTFRFILGFQFVGAQTPFGYWVILACCGVVLVIVCSFTFYFIERPCINIAGRVTNKIKSYLPVEEAIE